MVGKGQHLAIEPSTDPSGPSTIRTGCTWRGRTEARPNGQQTAGQKMALTAG